MAQNDILVYALHYEGEFNKNSLGAVSEGARLAKELGGECHALVLGGDGLTDELCGTLGASGAAKVFRAKGAEGLSQPVVGAMAHVMDAGGHRYAVFGGGLLGFEIGAGLAARLNAGVTMEVTAVRVEGGELLAERPILGDSSISTSRYRERGIVIGRLNAFEGTQADGATASVEDVNENVSHQISFLSSSQATIFSTVSLVSSSSMIFPGSLAGGALNSVQWARALS